MHFTVFKWNWIEMNWQYWNETINGVLSEQEQIKYGALQVHYYFWYTN